MPYGRGTRRGGHSRSNLLKSAFTCAALAAVWLRRIAASTALICAEVMGAEVTPACVLLDMHRDLALLGRAGELLGNGIARKASACTTAHAINAMAMGMLCTRAARALAAMGSRRAPLGTTDEW